MVVAVVVVCVCVGGGRGEMVFAHNAKRILATEYYRLLPTAEYHWLLITSD